MEFYSLLLATTLSVTNDYSISQDIVVGVTEAANVNAH